MDISMKIAWKPVRNWLRTLRTLGPSITRKAMVKTVAWWHKQAVTHAPVRASTGPGEYRSHGRGQLKKRIEPWIKSGSSCDVSGGLKFGAHYSKYLIWGTDRIAGGQVKSWEVGDAAITSWPAKRDGGNPRGKLPVALPWWAEARDRFYDELDDELAKALN